MYLREEIRKRDNENEELKQQLKAREFNPQEQSGIKLMKKCRNLLIENESLGRQICEGPIKDLLLGWSFEREKCRELFGVIK